MKEQTAFISKSKHFGAKFQPVRLMSALVVAAACSLSANAAVITSSGTLPDALPGAYALYNFNVTSAGATTFALAGNTDAFLGLFAGTNVLSNGTFIAQNDDSSGSLDSFLSLNLAAGSYTAWITTHGSVWDTSTDSIRFDHDHTPMSYTLTIDGSVAAGTGVAVPEPASLALLSLGIAGLVASRRNKA